MSDPSASDYVSIGFGNGETIIVAGSLTEIRELLERDVRAFVALIARPSGETVVINVAQVKVLQPCERPSRGQSGVSQMNANSGA